jgi:dTDP-4-amino-4,6-dideoxygalactose transaminase
MQKVKSIYVTQPFLPPFEEFAESLKKIWENKWLTNDGEFHQQFEKKVCEFLEVENISLFTNGTLALITALQALRITGDVITTPYSFVATTHALWWNGIRPIFVDIEPDYCNINPDGIEAAITPRTSAILPVHVYGNPCQVEKIQKIADIYGIRVIYDACHAFGVKLNNTSVLNFGDLSVLSFHATKVFNTFEGGAIVCHDKKTKQRIDYLKNFGFADEVTVVAPGINAKMNEFQASLGLHQLNYYSEVVEKRKRITELYREQLKDIVGIRVLRDNPDLFYNYAYFPIFIEKTKYGRSRDEVYNLLMANNIYSRRYFYPLISQFPPYRGFPSARIENLPVATKIANEVLCLPIYPDLDLRDVERITYLLKN